MTPVLKIWHRALILLGMPVLIFSFASLFYSAGRNDSPRPARPADPSRLLTTDRSEIELQGFRHESQLQLDSNQAATMPTPFPIDTSNARPALMTSLDHADRLEQVAELADSTDPRAIATLRSLLDYPDPLVQQEAVETLGLFDGMEAIEGLRYALLSENAWVRRIAIESLAAIGSDAAIASLAQASLDADPGLRESAVYELIALDSEMAATVLRQFLADNEATIRELVAEGLTERSLAETRIFARDQ